MIESALAALSSLADPSLLLMLVAGVVAGLIMGLIPGLGGTGAVAILLPVTFGMDPSSALACTPRTPWLRCCWVHPGRHRRA